MKEKPDRVGIVMLVIVAIGALSILVLASSFLVEVLMP